MGKVAVQHSACQVCGGQISARWHKKNRHGLFTIVGCNNCGFGFVNPTPDHEYILRYYSESGHGADEGLSRDTVDKVRERERNSPNSSIDAVRLIGQIKSYQPDGAFLDVGCGFGWFSLEAKRRGYQVTSLEIASIEGSIAAVIVGQEPISATFEDYEAPPESYEAILMSQVLEHAREPVEWVRKARRLLKAGGVLAIALPNAGSIYTKILGERDPYVIPPAHLNYFTPGSLSLLMQQCGFEVLRSETLSRFPASTFGKAGRFIKGPFNASTKAFDIFKMGAMIHLYARAV